MTSDDRITLERRLTSLEGASERLVEDVTEIKEALIPLTKFIQKYESRWGLLFMIGTATWAAIAVFKDELLKKFMRS